jgi:hypothetical protein
VRVVHLVQFHESHMECLAGKPSVGSEGGGWADVRCSDFRS